MESIVAKHRRPEGRPRPGGEVAPRPGRFPAGDVDPGALPLRVAIDGQPMLDLLSHAASSPDAEICGVLVGSPGRDSHGEFVHVTSTIRGERAREAGAQVTFTHETWDHIHREMDESYPGYAIVGWYHSHPGFDVFLSDMDAFIHRNFFGAPHHVALVHDPLLGRTALFTLRDGEMVPLDRYWRDGREIVVGLPHGDGSATRLAAIDAQILELQRRLVALEESSGPGAPSLFDRWVVPALLVVLAVAVLLFGYYMPSRYDAAILDHLSRLEFALVESGTLRLVEPSERGDLPPPPPAPARPRDGPGPRPAEPLP